MAAPVLTEAQKKAQAAFFAANPGRAGVAPVPYSDPSSQGNPGNTGIDTGRTMDVKGNLAQRIVEDAEKNRRENKHFLRTDTKPAVDAQGATNARANDTDVGLGYAQEDLAKQTGGDLDSIVGDLRGDFGKYKTGQQNLDTSDLGALAKYQGQIPGLLEQLQGLGWKDAEAATAGQGAQNDALAMYKSRTDTAISPQERFMSEVARRKQEQQERSSRDAVMGDLQARGMAGSGAQLTNMLGAQEQLGQERTLSELGAQSNAIDRSNVALKGYADTADNMAKTGNLLSMFNAQQGQTAREAIVKAKADLAGAGLKATTDVNAGIGTRDTGTYKEGKDVVSARAAAAREKYGMGQDTNTILRGNAQSQVQRAQQFGAAKMGLGALYTGQGSADAGAVGGAKNTQLGNVVADDAVAKAEEDDNLLFGFRT